MHKHYSPAADAEIMEAEHAAHKALFRQLGNPATSNPSVLGKVGAVANTNIVCHAGRLFALGEGHRPFAFHPQMFEAQGLQQAS